MLELVTLDLLYKGERMEVSLGSSANVHELVQPISPDMQPGSIVVAQQMATAGIGRLMDFAADVRGGKSAGCFVGGRWDDRCPSDLVICFSLSVDA